MSQGLEVDRRVDTESEKIVYDSSRKRKAR